MSEEKKKVAALDQDKMEDVKGGIPYEVPGLISLNESIAVPPPEEPVIPGDPGDPVTTGSGGCYPGSYNYTGGCGPGQSNSGQDPGGCVEGASNSAMGPCAAGQGVLHH